MQTANVALGLGVVIPPHLACHIWFVSPSLSGFLSWDSCAKVPIAVQGTRWVSPGVLLGQPHAGYSVSCHSCVSEGCSHTLGIQVHWVRRRATFSFQWMLQITHSVLHRLRRCQCPWAEPLSGTPLPNGGYLLSGSRAHDLLREGIPLNPHRPQAMG